MSQYRMITRAFSVFLTSAIILGGILFVLIGFGITIADGSEPSTGILKFVTIFIWKIIEILMLPSKILGMTEKSFTLSSGSFSIVIYASIIALIYVIRKRSQSES